ncbi:hypothetical protein MXB_1492 [Myxobolus squamalis]|nr:hypothetical protein MXB_1492 [Myxobolus squamalis]
MDLDHNIDATCPHIREKNELDILRNLRMIRKIFLYDDTEIAQDYLYCMSCKKVKSTLACLECAYTSCSSHINHDETHIHFVDLSFGQNMFCAILLSYNGENSVFSPHEFLSLVWRECPVFNLVEQHDAHEFFIRILDSIRKFDVTKILKNDPESPNSDNNTASNSIVDMAFFGTIESEIKCSVCSANLSTILEPFCDLSLEIYSQSDKLIRNTSSIFRNCNLDINLFKNSSNPISLEKCLNLFTKTESI